MFPYMQWDEKSHYKSEMEQMRAEYVAKFGDPSSPEAQAQAKRDTENLKRQKLMSEQKAKADAENRSKRERELAQLRNRRVKK